MSQPDETQPTRITSTALQRNIGSILRRVHNQKEHFIIERDGFPMMAIVPIEDYETKIQPPTPPRSK